MSDDDALIVGEIVKEIHYAFLVTVSIGVVLFLLLSDKLDKLYALIEACS